MSEKNSLSGGSAPNREGLPKYVLDDELREIGKRRGDKTAENRAVAGTLIGLALSGGGIRSAAFNLGVLQSFFMKGLLRHIDYLSTVSGGGYIGCWFSSLLNQKECEPRDPENKLLNEKLSCQAGGAQPAEVVRLARKGKYLDRMDKVWNHFSIGLICNNLAILSVLVFACLVIAYCWRALDEEVTVRWLYNDAHYAIVRADSGEADPRAGFDMSYFLKETVRPFLPFVILALLWLFVWSLPYSYALFRTAIPRKGVWDCPTRALFLFVLAPLSLVVIVLLTLALVAIVLLTLALVMLVLFTNHLAGIFVSLFWALLGWFVFRQAVMKKNRGAGLARVSDVLFVLAVAALAIGVAVYLAIPVQNLAPAGSRPQTVEDSSSWTHKVVYPLLGILLTALTPFLRPKRLLRSGLNPQNAWEGWMFTIATSALLYGVPLALIWLFARHDFAGRFALPDNKPDRSKQLESSDIVDPPSHRLPDRSKQLESSDIVDLNAFKKRIEAEKAEGDPGFFIKDKIAKAFKDRPDLALWWKALKQTGSPQEVKKDLTAVYPGWRLVQWTSEPPQQVRKDLAKVLNEEVIGNEANHRPEFMKKVWEKGRLGTKPTEFDQGALYRNVISRHPSAEQIALLMTVAETRDFKANLPQLNRLLFEAYYGHVVYRQDQIIRPNVIGRDQWWRRFWLLVTLGVAVASCFIVNLNATSMHNFYLERLADTFIRCGEGEEPPLLHTLDTTTKGGPYHLLSATVNHRPSEPAPSRSDPENLGQTRTEGFLLSSLYCGANSLGYQSTASYWGGRLRLADAMTISGAAVSPFQVTSWFIIVLMVLANARTGQWLPRPHGGKAGEDEPDGRLAWLLALLAGTFGPTFLGLALTEYLRQAAGEPGPKRKKGADPLYFLTDGGHHENLGLWPLLERCCRLIFVSDASEDGTSGFADLLRVIRRARFERGIHITACAGAGEPEHDRNGFLKGMGLPTDLAREDAEALTNLLELLRSSDEPTGEQLKRQDADGSLPPGYRRSNRHFFLAKVEYPNVKEPGYLIYLKPTLTGDEAADLQAYATQNRDFPHHPTSDQLYDEDRFESYRQLGEHIGNRLCEEFENSNLGKLWDCPSVLPLLLDERVNALLALQNAALEQLVLEKARRYGRIQRAESVPVASRH